MGWNYGDLLDGLARALPPDHPALIHNDSITTWSEFDQRSNRLASNLRKAGIATGDKVSFYLRNSPVYCELLAACFKGRFTHVNVNYRYVDDELRYIIDNSDSAVVVFDAEFAERIAMIAPQLPAVKLWLQVGTAKEEVSLPFAQDFAQWLEQGDSAPLQLYRSGDDLMFLYTGGTTGMPKGVMWAHDDHWHAGSAGRSLANNMTAPLTLEEHIKGVQDAGGGARTVPCCPLMHGTGLFTAIGALAGGGTIITLSQPSFDAAELWRTVDAHKATAMAIVGDAFAKPMLEELERNGNQYDISSVQSVISSGVMWSPEVKQGLLKHHQGMVLIDSFGASEAVGFGRSETTADGGTQVAQFVLGEHCKVFNEQFDEVRPGSGEVGYVARSGALPRGYYKDPDKTAKTFPTINGVRYSIPGDYCRVEADGSLVLLGRGSVCINTAGEKVYPEEVEEVLKLHEAVHDALVVGVPDDKWGQMVTAVIETVPGVILDEDSVRAHVRQRLAGYKTPKRVLVSELALRASNGKADYKSAKTFALQQLGLTDAS